MTCHSLNKGMGRAGWWTRTRQARTGEDRRGPVGTSDWSAGNRRHIHQDASDGSEGADDTAVGRTEWAVGLVKLPETRGEEASTTSKPEVKGSVSHLSRTAPRQQGPGSPLQPHGEETGENPQPQPPATPQSPAEAQGEAASWHGPHWSSSAESRGTASTRGDSAGLMGASQGSWVWVAGCVHRKLRRRSGPQHRVRGAISLAWDGQSAD